MYHDGTQSPVSVAELVLQSNEGCTHGHHMVQRETVRSDEDNSVQCACSRPVVTKGMPPEPEQWLLWEWPWGGVAVALLAQYAARRYAD